MSRAVGTGVGRAIQRALYGPPAIRTFATRLRPRACVLVYHRVGEPPSDPYGQAVAPERFARQLDAVRSRYHVLAVDDLLERLQGRDYRDGTVAVTFDDGYADTLTQAYPLAAGLGVPIHVFVTAGPVVAGARQFWWDELAALTAPDRSDHHVLHDQLRRLPAGAREERLATLRNGDAAGDEEIAGRPLTATEVTELAGLPLAAVGAHTLTHPQLAALPAAEQLIELVEGRRRLETLTGRSIDVLAYPFGKRADVSSQTRRLAADAGYVAAFLSTPQSIVPSSDRYALPRLTVHDWTAEVLLQRIADVLGPVPR